MDARLVWQDYLSAVVVSRRGHVKWLLTMVGREGGRCAISILCLPISIFLCAEIWKKDVGWIVGENVFGC